MNHLIIFFKKNTNKQGFVLPFTLLIGGIMLLISVSISTILIKQIYFSNIGRESQAAYYAADNALACALSVEDTYVSGTSGLFPYDTSLLTTQLHMVEMQLKLDSVNTLRGLAEPPSKILATTLGDIKCAQAVIFDTAGDSNFSVEEEDFVLRDSAGDELERGQTSSFTMKMPLSDGTFRCAKVIVNKTPSYKQIISQGYSKCDRSRNSVERAIVFTTRVE